MSEPGARAVRDALPRAHRVGPQAAASRQCHVRVTEHHGDVVFLHEVVAGAPTAATAIQVARLAGLPPAVIERSRAILANWRRASARLLWIACWMNCRCSRTLPQSGPPRLPPRPRREDALRKALADLHPDEMTPRAALEALYRLKGLG